MHFKGQYLLGHVPVISMIMSRAVPNYDYYLVILLIGEGQKFFFNNIPYTTHSLIHAFNFIMIKHCRAS